MTVFGLRPKVSRFRARLIARDGLSGLLRDEIAGAVYMSIFLRFIFPNRHHYPRRRTSPLCDEIALFESALPRR